MEIMNKTLAIILLTLGLVGCASEPPIPQQYSVILSKDVTIVVNVTNNFTAQKCKDIGGMWISGDTKEYMNVFSGCTFSDVNK